MNTDLPDYHLGDGLPEQLDNASLLTAFVAKAKRLVSLMSRRRHRDKATQLLTELWSGLEVFSLRISRKDAFDSGPEPRPWDEGGGNGIRIGKGREAWDQSDGDPYQQAEADESDEEEILEGIEWHTLPEEWRAGSLRELLEGRDGDEDERIQRCQYFLELISWFIRGCRDRSEIAAKVEVVAVALGLEDIKRYCGGKTSLAALSRKAKEGGETRQTTDARYRRTVEALLDQAGAKGKKLGGVTKSDSHRQACREAQTGRSGELSNRRRGHLARKGLPS